MNGETLRRQRTNDLNGERWKTRKRKHQYCTVLKPPRHHHIVRMREFPTKHEEVAIRDTHVRPVHQRIRRFPRTNAARTKHDVTKRTIPEPRIRNVSLEEITFDGLELLGIGRIDKEQTITTNRRRNHERALNEIQVTTRVYGCASTDGLRDLSKTNNLATLTPAYVVPREARTPTFGPAFPL